MFSHNLLCSCMCYLCLVFFVLSHLFIAALWSPAGKGLTSWLLFLMFNFVFVTFPSGILGQVWYLIAYIPDLYHLSYFYSVLPFFCHFTKRRELTYLLVVFMFVYASCCLIFFCFLVYCKFRNVRDFIYFL